MDAQEAKKRLQAIGVVVWWVLKIAGLAILALLIWWFVGRHIYWAHEGL